MRRAILIAIMVASVFTTPAAAQDFSVGQGCSVTQTVYGPGICPPPPTPDPDPPGELPFTGLETGLLGLVGMALLGGGVALRRATRAATLPRRT